MTTEASREALWLPSDLGLSQVFRREADILTGPQVLVISPASSCPKWSVKLGCGTRLRTQKVLLGLAPAGASESGCKDAKLVLPLKGSELRPTVYPLCRLAPSLSQQLLSAYTDVCVRPCVLWRERSRANWLAGSVFSKVKLSGKVGETMLQGRVAGCPALPYIKYRLSRFLGPWTWPVKVHLFKACEGAGRFFFSLLGGLGERN